MKHVLLGLFFLILLPGVTHAADWSISSFSSDSIINQDGTVAVKETIDANFTAPKHGIFRDIPYSYQDKSGNPTYTKIDVTSITDNNQTIAYEQQANSNSLRLKIGDPNHTETGQHTYTINYRATGILKSFNTYDELYWNATGNNWEVPIGTATVTVTLPQDGIVQFSCYEFKHLSTDQCPTQKLDDHTVKFTATRSLNLQEGLTVALDYTKGMVPILTVDSPPAYATDSQFSGPSPFSNPKTWETFGILTSLGIIGLFSLWSRSGRDHYWLRKKLHDPNAVLATVPILGEHRTIAPEFSPPDNLRPAEMGTLIDEKADTLDITATIVDLAMRGYLTITENPFLGFSVMVR